jgi:hypothetical protein
MYAANAALQTGFDALHGMTLDDVDRGYVDRFRALLGYVSNNPLEALNPISMIERLSPTWLNEPGRENRVYVGNNDQGRGIYMRAPVGKIGEEFTGYLNPISALRIAQAKESTILRPIMAVLSNDRGFGVPIYNADDQTQGSSLRAVGNIVRFIFESQLPTQNIQSAVDLMQGRGDPLTNALHVFGPLAGVTFSQGHPSGPEAGFVAAENRRNEHQFAIERDSLTRMVQGGQEDEAVDRMRVLGRSEPQIRSFIAARTGPAMGPSRGATRAFIRSENADAQDRMDMAERRLEQMRR